jgi:hypothetical protein
MMTTNNSVKVNVFFLIIFLAAALTVRLWASSKSEAINGPMIMRTGPDSSVYFPCENQLYIYGQEGGLIEIVPLSRFGITSYIDDFWVFENKDLLLRKEIAQKSIAARIFESLQRPGPRMIDRVVANESMTQRCSVKNFRCVPLEHGSEILNSLGIFRLFVDESKNNLYVSDNLGHELLLLDVTGKLVRKSGKNFEFPNQVSMGNNGLLYVADAEKHRIAAISTDYKTFGNIEQEFKVEGEMGKPYPVALAQAQSGEWWVVAAGMTMQNGALMIYSKEGTFMKTIELPEGADPFSIVAFENRVLVSDPTLMRIYSIGLDGTVQEDFGSDSLFLHLSYLRSRKKFYDSLASLSLAVLFVGLVIAFIFARSVAKSRIQTDSARKSLVTQELGPISRKYDYSGILKLFKIVAVVHVLLIILLFLLMLLTPISINGDLQFVMIMILLSPALLAIIYYLLKNSYIEITEQGITYTNGIKKIFSPWNDVQKIKAVGPQYRIRTAHGTIPVGIVTPVDITLKEGFHPLNKERTKYLQELIAEVRKRAPNAGSV